MEIIRTFYSFLSKDVWEFFRHQKAKNLSKPPPHLPDKPQIKLGLISL
jgi:hypothetical protein